MSNKIDDYIESQIKLIPDCYKDLMGSDFEMRIYVFNEMISKVSSIMYEHQVSIDGQAESYDFEVIGVDTDECMDGGFSMLYSLRAPCSCCPEYWTDSYFISYDDAIKTYDELDKMFSAKAECVRIKAEEISKANKAKAEKERVKNDLIKLKQLQDEYGTGQSS